MGLISVRIRPIFVVSVSEISALFLNYNPGIGYHFEVLTDDISNWETLIVLGIWGSFLW